ncbi:MAG: transposase [Bdellovibrionota bacterium]
MPRKHLIRTCDFPYHVTARSNNKDFFYLHMDTLWDIFMESMTEAEKHFNCQFHAFVLMSNHYHLLVSTPNSNLDLVMNYLQREIARKANKISSRINHFFGGPYKWSLICEESYYWNALKYIFRNPIRAGLCDNVLSYQFSSLNSQPKKFNWRLTDFFNNRNTYISIDLDWLNEPFYNETENNIQAALRRREFQIPCDANGYRPTLDTPLSKKGRPT